MGDKTTICTADGPAGFSSSGSWPQAGASERAGRQVREEKRHQKDAILVAWALRHWLGPRGGWVRSIGQN